MRTLFMTFVGCVALAFACIAVAAAGAKDEPKQLTGAEIVKLVKDLGDGDFRIRDKASKCLAQTPGALTMLRPFLKDKDLERGKRVEALVEDLTQKNFKKLLREIVNRKREAPVDLLVDLVAHNSERMDGEDWKAVLATIASIKASILNEAKTKPNMPDFNQDFFPLLSPIDLASSEVRESAMIQRGKLFCHRLEAKQYRLLGSAVVATGSIEVSDCVKSMVVAGSSIESQSCIECIILANGNVSLRDTYSLSKSFVFTDGDVICSGLNKSVVVARGRIKAKKTRESEVIEEAGDSSRVALFSMKTIGLVLVQQEQPFRVEKVIAASVAAKSGFRIGDVLLSEPSKAGGLQRFERELRQSLAKNSEAVLQVHREGRHVPLILCFHD